MSCSRKYSLTRCSVRMDVKIGPARQCPIHQAPTAARDTAAAATTGAVAADVSTSAVTESFSSPFAAASPSADDVGVNSFSADFDDEATGSVASGESDLAFFFFFFSRPMKFVLQYAERRERAVE
jgi:hypothetical protein